MFLQIFVDVFADIRIRFQRARFERKRTRPVDAGGIAAVHFDEHTRKALDVFEDLFALLGAVHGDKLVSVNIIFKRFDDAAADGIILCAVDAARRVRRQAGDLVQDDPLVLKHGGEVLKREDAVHNAALLRFPLFGDARPDKHDLCVRPLFADHLGVRDHGRIHGSEVLQCLGIVQLDQRIDGGTAGSDKVFILSPFQQFFILRRHFPRADAGFLRVRKTQPAEGKLHDGKILQIERGDKGGRDGRYDVAAL